MISHPLRRRVAAVAALAAGVLATALLLTTILTNPLASLLSVFAFAVGVASGWVALTNRGRKRGRAIVVGLAATALLVAALVNDDEHRWFLLFALGSAMLASICGRVALGHAARRPTTDEPVGRAQHPALVVNPKSGDGRAAQLGLVERARDLGIDVHVLDSATSPLGLARQAVAAGADALGIAGGDGSLAPIAALAAEHGIDFVCIPAGTRNHFAQDLGLDRSDPLAALAAFGPAYRRRIDLAWVNERPFVNNVSLGLYGEIVQEEGYRGDKWGTALARLPDLITENPQQFDLRYTDAEGVIRNDAQVVHVSNNPYALTVGVVGSRPDLTGGQLGIVCLRVDGGVRVAEAMARTVIGSGNSGSMQAWSSPTFEVRSGGPVPAGIDGEAVTLEPPLRFRADPAALTVRIPATAPGQSPAALRPTYRFAIQELVRRAFRPTHTWLSPEQFSAAR